ASGLIPFRTTVRNPYSLSGVPAVPSSDGELTVLVLAKASASTPVTTNVANYTHPSTAQAWQLTSANAITRLSDISFVGNALNVTVPPQSVTLFVIAAAGLAPTRTLAPRPTSSATTASSTLKNTSSQISL